MNSKIVPYPSLRYSASRYFTISVEQLAFYIIHYENLRIRTEKDLDDIFKADGNEINVRKKRSYYAHLNYQKVPISLADHCFVIDLCMCL